jgi:valyl-tRNA synthetase
MRKLAFRMSDLEARTRYNPSEAEPRIVERWLASGLFSPAPEGDASENYSIAIPPPNVTGVLHMGHAFQDAIMDTLIRSHRMRGQRTKWIIGTDHAGIATQTKVEQQLREEGLTREQVGREAFQQRVWDWRASYGGTIIEQLKRIGASGDFDDEHFTLDAHYAQVVQKVFVALYEKGYIYRDRYLVNWDPGSRSAISDLEVEDREVTDTLYYVDYPLVSGEGAITVATVRPETMLADVAVAVHPDDDRYRHLVGQKVCLPLVGRELEIIADDYVKPEFGTGALKITPAHDPNDFEIGLRHGLDQPSVIGEDGTISGPAPERFLGLTVADAQAAVVAELREAGLLARTESYTHTVPFSQRSGVRVEPLISLQWFMRMDELAAPAIDAVRSGRIQFHPARWSKVYLDWMENIRPWCISRQLWWGHQIPVWYRGEETHVGTQPPEGEGWTRDPDVLDTWFSSALWPFVTLGWPEQTPDLKAFYPTDVLVTSRDIIFLWVARMVMMGLEFTGQIPFEHVHIHAIIQAPDGRRMSKSLGTGIDPLDLVNGGPRPPVFAPDGSDPGEFPAYGADAVRWGLLAMSSGQDVRFNEEKVSQALQLTNKLWNAARLVLLRVDPEVRAQARPVAVEDRWILSRLQRARSSIDGAIANYEFARAALELYDFVYGELCDWYLELVKPRLYDGDADTAATLLHVLTETVTLAHPLIPFVTEEIYSYIPGAEGMLAARTAPSAVAEIDPGAEAVIERLITAVQALRTWRDSAELKQSALLSVRLRAGGYEAVAAQLARLARVEYSDDGQAEAAATVVVPGGTIEVLPSPELDPAAATAKRERHLQKLQQEIERAEHRLANAGFVAKAPAAVVDGEREKLARLQTELEAL